MAEITFITNQLSEITYDALREIKGGKPIHSYNS